MPVKCGSMAIVSIGSRERKLQDLRCRFGFLFQGAALFDSENVAGNVGFPLKEHSRLSPAKIAQIVAQKLRMVGLPGIEKKMPSELSGGQRSGSGWHGPSP